MFWREGIKKEETVKCLVGWIIKIKFFLKMIKLQIFYFYTSFFVHFPHEGIFNGFAMVNAATWQ